MEINWKVLQVERLVENGLVVKVTYSCNGKSDNFTDRVVNTLELTGSTDTGVFIPYEDLKEEDVLLWVESSLGEKYSETEEQVKQFLNKKEEELFNQQTEKGLPWRVSRLREDSLK